ncbi:cytochrome c oxidase subunit 3 family protein [Haliangium ochraceum]|uniref:Cytochrome c oxidase subunit III n=1 Tax=Haliangium ochraceum (strain DSM 14365 / JCM 11303 / SMP-2) TaxID=502025 RepID=D0LN56_HALO1|nr:cytochrome c oxidase subunit 3 family protein [Haliangium ochraceum]ACY15233.1 cytochrome c oxidase subunit III [Haliangium ochraceum DSM 14365]
MSTAEQRAHSAAPAVAEPAVAEHFQDLAQQHQAARLGMWVFLASETLLFAALFGLYVAYRVSYGDAFVRASHENDMLLGTVNTAILITSSLCAAWAVAALRGDRARTAALSLGATVVLGAAFLGLKLLEYRDHFAHGIYPGRAYEFAELPGAGARLFFTLYYALTGLHALHVVAGMVLLALLARATWRGRYSSRDHVAVENGALYWHLVDVVWIFLWPLLYLAG